MSIRDGLKSTGEAGVFYREHPTRKHGVKRDRQWVLRQTLGGKTRVSVLGWTSEGILQGDALNKAAEYRGNHKWNRANPDQPSRPVCIADERLRQEDKPLFEEFAERFIAQHCKKKLKPATAGEYERQIRRDLIPAWGKRHLADIKRQQVAGLIESKSDTAPIMANRLLATIKKMFSYALEVGLIKENPASPIKPPAKEKGGDGRILTIPEIKSLFETVSGDLGDFLKIVTLTALRPGEVTGLRLKHIRTAVDGLWIELSGAETKNGKPTRIFLNPMAERIIKSRTVEDFLFPAKTKSGHTLLTTFESRLRKIRPQLSMESFTPHDLRRSAATGLSKLGYTGLVPNILNHSPKGITRQIYDLYDLAKEIKEAMTAWGEAIEKNLTPVREVQNG